MVARDSGWRVQAQMDLEGHQRTVEAAELKLATAQIDAQKAPDLLVLVNCPFQGRRRN